MNKKANVVIVGFVLCVLLFAAFAIYQGVVINQRDNAKLEFDKATMVFKREKDFQIQKLRVVLAKYPVEAIYEKPEEFVNELDKAMIAMKKVYDDYRIAEEKYIESMK